MTYEELEALINGVRDAIGEESSALISEDLLNVLSNYKNLLDELNAIKSENEILKNDKEELLKTNGKLFQKIGFDKKEEKSEDVKTDEDEEKSTEEIIDELIDEKGEIV